MKRKLICGCLLAALSLSACSKKDDPGATDFIVEVKVQKEFNAPVTPVNVNIYKTKEDYNTNSNVYISGRTGTDGRFLIPLNKLIKGHSYYADWYSDDFLFNNWAGFRDHLVLKYTDSMHMFGIGALGEYNNLALKRYLDGNKTETNWTAVGAMGYGGEAGVWEGMVEHERYLKIKLRKDLSGFVTTKDAGGGIMKSTDFSYVPGYSYQISLELPNGTLQGLLNAHDNGGPDTLTYVPVIGTRMYLMIKE